MSIQKNSFGFIGEKEVFIYTLKNEAGTTLNITTYGATIVNLLTPDKNGHFDDVVLGYDNIDSYVKGTSKHGALVGRFANRISDGRFTLNGIEYKLDKNDNGINHIHGGNSSYSAQIWDVIYTCDYKEPSLSLSYTEPDGTENYPGTVSVNAVYTLTKDNSVKIDLYAQTDKDTVINLTNHAFFNLNGCTENDILGHSLQIFADHFTPINKNIIPTGEIRSVKGTPFDFTSPKTIGQDICADDEQLIIGKGYDHNYITGEVGKMKHIAKAYAPESGRIMDVYSDLPGVQLYTGNYLNGEIGKNGIKMNQRNGFCLETQFYPDSPNHPEFPSCVLKPSDKYHFTTIFSFSHT